MAVNTRYLSANTTDLTSDLSVQGSLDVTSTSSLRGAVTLFGALNSASALSGGAATVSTVNIGAGTTIQKISSATVGVVALTVAATKSTTTTATFSGATVSAVNPQVYNVSLGNASALSAGVVVQCFPSDADQVTLSYSNVSTANAAQTAHTVRITMMQF